MSTSGGDIEFSFRGNAAQLMGELRKIDGGIKDTAAKGVANVSNLKKGFSALDKGAGSATTSTQRLAAAMGPLGGVLSRVSPQAGALASTIAGLGGTFGGLSGAGVSLTAAVGPVGVMLGAVAAAALPLAGHMVVLAREEAQAAARADLLAQSSRDLAPSLDAVDDAALRAAVATGRLTEEQGKLQAAQDAASKSTRDFSSANDEQRDAANEAYFTARKWLGYAELLPSVLTTAIDYYGGFSDTMRESTRTLLALGDGEDEHQDNVATGLALTGEAIVAEGAKGRARETGTVSTRGATDAERAYSDALQSSTAAAAASADSYFGVLDSLQAAEDKANDARLGGIAKIEAARDAEFEGLRRRYEEGLALTAENNSAREELDRQYAASRAAIEADAQSQIAAVVEEGQARIYDAEQRTLEARLEANTALVSSIGDGYGALGDLFGQIADTQASEGKRGAMASFYASQAFAVAQAGIATALAVVNALATVPYPAAPVAAVAAGVAGAAQLAAILATPPPSRHGGGALYPDEAMVKMRAGESALTPEATARMGGPGGVAAFNAGGGMGGGMSIRVGRHVFREAIRTDIRAGGIVTQEIDRRVARSSLGAGVSGKTALA